MDTFSADHVSVHPLVQEAIEFWGPRGGPSAATNLQPESAGTIRLVPAEDFFRPAGPMARWARKRLRDQPISIDTIYLAEALASWTTADQPDFVRYAPQRLTPLAYDDKTRTFKVKGASIENSEFAAAMATRNGRILNVDNEFAAAIVLSAEAREAIRKIDPRENPKALEARAFRRLLGEKSARIAHSPKGMLADMLYRRESCLDENQEAALQSVFAGEDTLILGPPGTGKSEVIAEITRVALSGMMNVLVASNVQSALDVAERRLTRDFVHKHSALFFGPTLQIARPDNFHQNLTYSADPYDLLIVDEATLLISAET